MESRKEKQEATLKNDSTKETNKQNKINGSNGWKWKKVICCCWFCLNAYSLYKRMANDICI